MVLPDSQVEVPRFDAGTNRQDIGPDQPLARKWLPTIREIYRRNLFERNDIVLAEVFVVRGTARGSIDLPSSAYINLIKSITLSFLRSSPVLFTQLETSVFTPVLFPMYLGNARPWRFILPVSVCKRNFWARTFYLDLRAQVTSRL